MNPWKDQSVSSPWHPCFFFLICVHAEGWGHNSNTKYLDTNYRLYYYQLLYCVVMINTSLCSQNYCLWCAAGLSWFIACMLLRGGDIVATDSCRAGWLSRACSRKGDLCGRNQAVRLAKSIQGFIQVFVWNQRTNRTGNRECPSTRKSTCILTKIKISLTQYNKKSPPSAGGWNYTPLLHQQVILIFSKRSIIVSFCPQWSH